MHTPSTCVSVPLAFIDTKPGHVSTYQGHTQTDLVQ